MTTFIWKLNFHLEFKFSFGIEAFIDVFGEVISLLND